MRKRSILWRFILPFITIIVVTTISVLFLFSRQSRELFISDIRSTLNSEASLLAAELSQYADGEPDLDKLREIVKRYSNNLGLRVTIINQEGKVVAESAATAEMMVNHLNRPEVQQVLTNGNGFNIRYSTTLKTEMIYVAVGQMVDGQLRNIVRLAKPISIINERLNETRRVIILSGIVAILLVFAVTLITARRTIRPILQLTESARKITRGDFSQLPVPGTDNEINDLTRAFSKMASQLQLQISTISSQNANLETIVDRLMDGLIIVTREGYISMVNQTAKSLLGVNAQSGIGDDFIKTVQQYQLVELWQKTIESGQDQAMFIELKNRGRYILGMSTFLGTPQEGTVLILIQDRTKNRQLEELRQNFVSNVSHELRTPLSTLKALIETLQKCIHDDPFAAEKFLMMMDVEIDKLTQMVLELLDLSRIESGRVTMQKQTIAVKDLLKNPVERMQPQAERARIDLRFECQDGLPTLNVDVEQIERVLINIIHNAIKYTPQGGSIVVSAKQENNEILISVQDTGEGIDETDLPRIFERFYKTDQARASGGTGLGLSIAKHIIDAHQGRIWAESKKGSGSTFTIGLKIK